MIKKISLMLVLIWSITAKAQLPIYVVPNIDWIKYFSQSSALVGSPSAIDVNSNVYTTGSYGLSTLSDLIALKYDSLGTLTYSYSFSAGNYDIGKAIKVDAAGNAYIAGTSYTSTTKNDFVVIKLSPTGSVVYNKRIDGGGNKDDDSYDIAIDAAGNAYITGKSLGANGWDIKTTKLKTNGATAWQHTYTGAGTGTDIGTGIVLSSNGQRVYVTGITTSTATGSDIITMEINATSGATTWTAITNGSANGNDYSNGIILNGSNPIVCGEINNTTTGMDYTTIKYNGSGVLWKQDYDFLNTTGKAKALAKDSAGNIGVVGTVLNGSTIEYHTLLYNNSGTLLQVNKESTGCAATTADPKICNDTIAHHWYVSGEIMNNSKDIFVYQITPTGNTSWRKSIDGLNTDVDVATSIGVNGVGVVYVGGQSKNSAAAYDFTTIKINQMPVYFPPDIVANETPNVRDLYYENKGQIVNSGTTTVSDVVFATMWDYPNAYVTPTRLSYKFHRRDTLKLGMDTTQRVDIEFVGANKLTTAYPVVPNHGSLSIFDAALTNSVLDIQGYERYFIPNVYPSIDAHYYSNENGIKLYFVVKPGASPSAINWRVVGATSSTIAGTNLEIKGFNGKVIFDQPAVYTVTSSTTPTAVALTSTVAPAWISTGAGSYAISTPTYNPMYPIIIELDYGNTINSSAGVGNFDYSTFIGGSVDDGLRTISVDKKTGEYVAVGTNNSYVMNKGFPTVPSAYVSSTVTSSSGGYVNLSVFDKTGKLQTTNIWGMPNYYLNPVGAVMSSSLITFIGNCSASYTAFPTNYNHAFITPGTYTNATGPGYLMQFEYYLNGLNVRSANKVRWFTQLNGYASGISMKPKSKELYVTTTTNFSTYIPDVMPQTGSYYHTTAPDGDWHGQISKYDSVGIRKWSTIFLTGNAAVNTFTNNDFAYSGAGSTESNTKFKIDCDNYGFVVTGELSSSNLTPSNKYGAAITTTYSGNKDAFVSRFNYKDTVVFSTYVGGSGDEVFNKAKITRPNEITVVGYSSSQEYKKLVKFSSPTQYVDSAVVPNKYKILINKFDTLGNKLWGTLYGGTTTATSNAWSITSDNLKKIYVAGKTTGNINMQPINHFSSYTKASPLGQDDAYILSFDSLNNLIWNSYYGGSYSDGASELDFNPFGNRIITVGITSTPHFGSLTNLFPTFTSPTYTAAYYTAYINSSTTNSTSSFSNSDGHIGWFYTALSVGIKEYFDKKDQVDLFGLFPNPTNEVFYLTLSKAYTKNVTVSVYNELGQIVYNQFLANAFDNTLIPMQTINLKNGVYIVKVADSEKTYSKKLIIAGK